MLLIKSSGIIISSLWSNEDDKAADLFRLFALIGDLYLNEQSCQARRNVCHCANGFVNDARAVVSLSTQTVIGTSTGDNGKRRTSWPLL